VETTPARLLVFTGLVGAGGAALISVGALRVSAAAAFFAIIAVLLSESFVTHVREQADASLTNVVVLVSLLYGGAALAVVATAGSLIPFARRAATPRTSRVAFNVGQLAISAAIAGLVFEGLLRLLGGSFPDAGSLIAISVAAVTYSLVNQGLVSVVITLVTKEPARSVVRSLGPGTAMQIPYVGLAVLAAVLLIFVSPWALVLMVVPAAIARFALLSYERVDEAYDRLVRAFVKAIEVKDLYTRGHSERVARLSVAVAEELGVPYDERRLTRYAALLHDVGKIGVPLCVINKPGPLDEDEFEHIKQHPTIGADILRDIDFLAPAIDIVRYHHERLDGAGYPYGIGGDDLSQIVRIVTAVDAFDAMTSTRSYRQAFGVEDAIAELRRCAGRQFDAEVVEALTRTIDRIGWVPTTDFASSSELHGHAIPAGTLEDRVRPEVSG
jgi:putative nucleotidyltransferase with HDIG domain